MKTPNPESRLSERPDAGETQRAPSIFDEAGLAQELKEAHTRYSHLRNKLPDSGKTESIEPAALAELSAALEELSVTEEELRVQNQALRDAYYEVETQRLHYEELFALIPDAYLVTDSYATILEVNRAAEKLLGVPMDRLRGKPLAVYVADEGRREFRSNLTRATTEAEPMEWTMLLAPRSATPMPVLARVSVLDDATGYQRLGWILQDLTDKQRAVTLSKRFAEEQGARIHAERAARRFRALAELSRLLATHSELPGISESIARTVVRFIGDHCEILISEHGELKSAASWDRTPRHSTLVAALQRRYHMTLDDPDSLVWKAYHLDQPQVSPVPSPPRPGSRKDLFDELRQNGPRNAIAVPISHAGRTLGVMIVIGNAPTPEFGPEEVGTLLEIANRAAVAIRNVELVDDLGRANREKTDFLAVLSHELRTPLTAVIGYSDLLLSGIPEPLSDIARDQVERIRSCSWHQLGVVEQILKYARVETGKDSPEFAPVDIATLVDEVTELVNTTSPGEDVQLSVDVPASITIESDAGRLRQILVNLVSNAFKFTDKGAVSMTVRRTDDHVFFTVADTGIGIAQPDLDRVFDPFWRAEAGSPTGRRSGMGLGLAVSVQLARSLGGELTVQSQVGMGAVFTLRVPIR